MTAVYEYKNEKITKFSESHLLGTYELVNHDNAEKDGSMLRTLRIKLEKEVLLLVVKKVFGL